MSEKKKMVFRNIIAPSMEKLIRVFTIMNTNEISGKRQMEFWQSLIISERQELQERKKQ